MRRKSGLTVLITLRSGFMMKRQVITVVKPFNCSEGNRVILAACSSKAFNLSSTITSPFHVKFARPMGRMGKPMQTVLGAKVGQEELWLQIRRSQEVSLMHMQNCNK